MSTMAELATEYRKESARLAIRIREKEALGAPQWEITEMKKMLQELRAKQRILSGYYDAPRDSSITLANCYAPKRRREDDG